MALQTFGGLGFPFPGLPIDIGLNTTASSYPFNRTTSYTIDAVGEKAGLKFRAWEAKNIRKVHVRTGTVTTGDTLDVRIETIGATTGKPTGTLWATNTNVSLVVQSSTDNDWLTATLTADATLALGDDVGIVIANGAGGGNMQFSALRYNSGGSTFGLHYTGGAWALQVDMPMILVEFSDGTFATLGIDSNIGGVPVETAINTGTATTRLGNIFTLPAPTLSKGCWAWVYSFGAGSGPYVVRLYAADGTTVLATTPTVTEFAGLVTARPVPIPWTTPVSLSAGVAYRVVVAPTASADVYCYSWTFPSAAVLDMLTGGQNCHYTAYTSSAWAQTTTARAAVGIYCNSFDRPAGRGLHVGL